MTAAVPDPSEDIDWSQHRGSCRVFYAERRCTCGAVPDPSFRDRLAAWVAAHGGANDHERAAFRAGWDAATAEVDARVQAAAEQRAVEGGPLRCTYCGGSLRVNTEWTGLAYMQTQEPESIECDDCDATWEPGGTLRDAAKWVRYPDLYAAPARAGWAA